MLTHFYLCIEMSLRYVTNVLPADRGKLYEANGHQSVAENYACMQPYGHSSGKDVTLVLAVGPC